MKFYKRARKIYRKGRKAYKFAKAHQSQARQALALAKKVARVVNVEYKFVDYIDSTTVNSAGYVDSICNVPEGDTVNERDGDSIKLMRVSGRIFVTQSSDAEKTALRLILFRGKNENQQPYSVQDILETSSHLSPKAHYEKFRSKIIYDKLYHMSNNGNSSLILNWNFKLYGHLNFGQGTTPNHIEDGGLYLLVISNEATNVPTINSYLRITYTDN